MVLPATASLVNRGTLAVVEVWKFGRVLVIDRCRCGEVAVATNRTPSLVLVKFTLPVIDL